MPIVCHPSVNAKSAQNTPLEISGVIISDNKWGQSKLKINNKWGQSKLKIISYTL